MKNLINFKTQQYTNLQIYGLTFLRLVIGWHFLYEGLFKLYLPGWSAKSYLMGSTGPFASLYKNIAQNESVLYLTDVLNIWGLIIIGLSLFIGLFSKPCKYFGILLLLLYYLAYPPFAELGLNMSVEGNSWIVNKNLIEMAALIVLILFPSSHITGIDRFIFNKAKVKFA
jgi:thiosulfate dehydrogenase (quinone) large subunit